MSSPRGTADPTHARRARAATRALAAALALAPLFAAPPAAAFCRSTTCTGDCPRDDNGCKTVGKPLFWAGMCVGFSLQKDGTVNLPMKAVRPAIEAAFVAWSDVECSRGEPATLAFAPLDDVACKKSEYNEEHPNANVVLFQDTKWTYQGIDNTLAKTTVTYNDETGEIYDADIEINHAYNEFTVGDDYVVYDLQSIVAHEVGHFIGLDHSTDVTATMFAGYDEGDTSLRTIELDDIEGVCTIYPPDREARCDPDPRNGLGNDCAPVDPETGEPVDEGGCAIAPAEAPELARGGAPAVSLGLAALALLRRRRFVRRR